MATSPALQKALEIYFTHHHRLKRIQSIWKRCTKHAKIRALKKKTCIFRKDILSKSLFYVIVTLEIINKTNCTYGTVYNKIFVCLFETCFYL